jgi:hypothetical protein
VTVKGKQRIAPADELETACLDRFEEMYTRKPLANERGKKKVVNWDKLYERFPLDEMRNLLLKTGGPAD